MEIPIEIQSPIELLSKRFEVHPSVIRVIGRREREKLSTFAIKIPVRNNKGGGMRSGKVRSERARGNLIKYKFAVMCLLN